MAGLGCFVPFVRGEMHMSIWEAAEVPAWEPRVVVSTQVDDAAPIEAFRSTLSAAYTAPPVVFSAPDDLVLNGRFFNIMACSRGLVPDSLHLMEQYKLTEFFDGIQGMMEIKGEKRQPLIAGNCGAENYFHWTMESMAAILAYKTFVRPEGGSVICQFLNPMRKESLKTYQVKMEMQQVMPVQLAIVSAGIYSNLTGGSYTFAPHPEIIRLLREPLGRVGPSRKFGKRLYISRKDSTKRRMLNEDAVCTLMTAKGFDVIETGKLSINDQMSMFRDAEIIVSPHGAALTNLIYCDVAKRRTKVVELLQANYLYGCFGKISQLLGLDHTFTVNPQAELPRGVVAKTVDDTVWRADLELLEQTLDTVMAAPAAA